MRWRPDVGGDAVSRSSGDPVVPNHADHQAMLPFDAHDALNRQ